MKDLVEKGDSVVLKDGEKVVGFAGFSRMDRSDIKGRPLVELMKFSILSEYRG